MTEFIDAEAYSPTGNKNDLTFKQIVLDFLKKMGSLASVEFRGGYWINKFHKVEGTQFMAEEKNYIPDSREVYCNAVEFLQDILYPHFDEKMLKGSDTIESEINALDCNGDDYPKQKLRLCRKLFREISCFLKRENYFMIEAYIDS